MGIFTDKKMNYDIDLRAGLDIYGNNSITLILEQIKPTCKVLEFGPAYGRMTKCLKEQLQCNVTCVELNKDTRKSLEKYAEKVIIGDIETYEWETVIGDELYDAIIFADVLEHLYNPKEVLKRTEKYLKQDGRIYISFPNVSHSAILECLYNDEFEYQDCGLLDETHIRFFTKKSFEKLIKEIGLYVVSKSATYYTKQMTGIVGAKESNRLFEEIVAEKSDSEVYQWIYGLGKENVGCTDFLKKNQECLKVYIDYGLGFKEENTITYLYDMQGRNQFEIEIPAKGIIKSLRIDPMEKSCIAILNNWKIWNENGELDVTVTGNFSCVEENIYLFEENDPQWVFNDINQESAVSVFFDLSFYFINLEKSTVHKLYTLFCDKQNTKLMDILSESHKSYIDKEDALIQKVENLQAELEEKNLFLIKKDEDIKEKSTLLLQQDRMLHVQLEQFTQMSTVFEKMDVEKKNVEDEKKRIQSDLEELQKNNKLLLLELQKSKNQNDIQAKEIVSQRENLRKRDEEKQQYEKYISKMEAENNQIISEQKIQLDKREIELEIMKREKEFLQEENTILQEKVIIEKYERTAAYKRRQRERWKWKE